jgi:predicted enzyme related to lactoylglutathione lyase
MPVISPARSIRVLVLAAGEGTSSWAFYVDALGLEARAGMDASSQRLGLGVPGQNDVCLILGSPPADPGICFAIVDLDDSFDRLAAYGAEVIREPISRPDGSRECAFLGPAGNVVRLIDA